MKQTAMFLLALSVTSLLFAQERKPIEPRASKTTLEVQEFGKEFEQWTKSLTISKPEVLTFRWITKEGAVASAKWLVSDITFASRPVIVKQDQSSKPVSAAVPRSLNESTDSTTASGTLQRRAIRNILKEGTLPNVATSQTASFQIDFADLVPVWPPAAPHVYRYKVEIVTLGQSGRPIGINSPAVEITYKAPGAAIQLSSCNSNQDCWGSGLVCSPISHTCVELLYRCEEDHLILGTDGTVSDCSPYRCVGNTCRTSCSSVDQCWPPNVCDPHEDCVTP